MLKMCRVVVTGTGAFTSYGRGTEILWENLLAGRTIVEKIPETWKISTSQEGIYAPLPEVDYREFGFSRMELMQYESVNLNMLMAVEEALQNANIDSNPINDKLNSFHLEKIEMERFGIFGGTGIGGIDSLVKDTITMQDIQYGKKGKLDMFTIAKAMPNSVSAAIGIKLNAHKNIHSYTYACATGTITIGKAYEYIRQGLLDIAVAGSSEYFDQTGAAYNSFQTAKTLVTSGDPVEANCPFDERRSGFLFSQGGAGALVLESLEHAKKRGAVILAEIVGFGESFDGYNMVSGDPSGYFIEKMLEKVLSDANVTPDAIDYINAHGTGTKKNDEIESAVFEKLFTDRVAINSTKSLLGHSIGASGAIEAIVTVLSIRDQKVHRNNALKHPLKNLNFVRDATAMQIGYAFSNSSAFGGHNGALLFRAYEDSICS